MTDFDKLFKKIRKSPIYWYEYYKLSISEYLFCLKCRIFKQCYKCNYMKEDVDIENREITVYCGDGKSINKLFITSFTTFFIH